STHFREEGATSHVKRKNTMRIQSFRALRGPNVWSDSPAIETLHLFEDGDSLDSRHDLASSIPERLAGVLRLTNGRGAAGMAEAVALLARGIQEEAGIVGLDRARTGPGEGDGEFHVIVPYREEAVGRLAVELAVEILSEALEGVALADFSERFGRL